MQKQNTKCRELQNKLSANIKDSSSIEFITSTSR